MIVGILKEIKAEENRVSMTPAGVEIMRQNGNRVLVEKNAGTGSGFADAAYIGAGAEMQKPLAIAVIGGLSVSTVITLVFVPALLALVDRK